MASPKGLEAMESPQLGGKEPKTLKIQLMVTRVLYIPQICPPATAKDVATFKEAMGVCFKRAVDAKLSIALSPRLDDGLGLGGWRNGARSFGCRVLASLVPSKT